MAQPRLTECPLCRGHMKEDFTKACFLCEDCAAGGDKMPEQGPGGIPWNYYICLLEFAKALQSKDRPAASIDKDGWLKVTYPEFVVKVKISEITVEAKG